jgi:hypothetical protein
VALDGGEGRHRGEVEQGEDGEGKAGC